MAQIKLNAAELKQYGVEIKGMGSQFKDILDEITKKVEEINNSWDGLAADSYAEVYNTTKTTLADLVPAVEGIGKTVEDIAAAWEETDKKLANV